MIRSRLTFKTALPWLLIIVVMALGAALTSCGKDAPAATPTPTKTPRPAAAEATALPEPTQAPPQAPTAARHTGADRGRYSHASRN